MVPCALVLGYLTFFFVSTLAHDGMSMAANNSSTHESRRLTLYWVFVLACFTFISVMVNIWRTSFTTIANVGRHPGMLDQHWKIKEQVKNKATLNEKRSNKHTKAKKPQSKNAKETMRKEAKAKTKSRKNVTDTQREKLQKPLQKTNEKRPNKDKNAEKTPKANIKEIPKKMDKKMTRKSVRDIKKETPRSSKKAHQVAGLNCDSYGGPPSDMAQEMVYWQDIPSDNAYVSPFKKSDTVQYMTFEPDGAGWNNKRMAMETVLALAYATGRTLVLPPDQHFYMMDDKTAFSFNNFFHLESIANEHQGGLAIVTMKEFLSTVAMQGKLVNQTTKQISFPPHNRTDWDGEERETIQLELDIWLRSVADKNTVWDPNTCMASFASTTDQDGVDRLEKYFYDINKSPEGFGSYQDYIGKPSPVDAPPQVRMRENWAGRERLCVYDLELQKAPLIHFPMDDEIEGARLLVHFYAFVFFEDWKQDLWMKRFVRDHVRYVDEIQCAAARVVHAIREHARKRNATNTKGDFDAFHIRRGDFFDWYPDTSLSGSEIYKVSKKELTQGGTVYIASDEREKEFFQPLADHCDLLFLDDFKHLIHGLNPNYHGMLDQLIASRSRVFFGCWFSTFSSYINRMRGYHADKEKLPGYQDGLVDSYYYAPKVNKYRMREFFPVKQTYHSREYPASWRGIDKGIGFMLERNMTNTKK